MAQRSLHAFMKVNPISYVLLCHRFPLAGYNRIPSGPFQSCKGFPLLGTIEYPQASPAPCGLVGIAIPVPLFQQDKLTRAFLISKQVIPYWTCGGRCCPGVSTPRIHPLADSSMTIHITWRNPTVSTIPSLLKSQLRSSPWSRETTSHQDTSQTKHHKGWKEL
jgi:hypothetical protein